MHSTDLFKNIPKKYHPKGFNILYEDRDIIVGNKAPGFLTVAALWNKTATIHYALNQYVRKGNSKSRKCVFVVHRLDQDTSGVLIFAKSIQAQQWLKNNWKDTVKIYYAVVHGAPAQKSGTISSYLTEDEDYVVHSSRKDKKGKLSHTEYEVLKEVGRFSLLKIKLLTGRKNQIRVHLVNLGHPVVGDVKYGRKTDGRYRFLALHAHSIAFKHPFHQAPLHFTAEVPGYFRKLIDYAY
ncbi:MAG: RluA family pseudouridine synthase [Candidatus Omnitrophica bacterium]|nr:RluA family pseudouridine synthase [Candidatus Omnitrophota bacterium]